MVRPFHETRLRRLAAGWAYLALLVGGCATWQKSGEQAPTAKKPDPVPGPGEVFVVAPDGSQIRRRATSWRESQRQNVVLQQYDYSCGTGALATLLQYYFQDKVLEQKILDTIFQRLAKSENAEAELKDRYAAGLSMLDLQRAAADLGYDAAIARLPLSKVAQSQAPVIVRLQKYDFKHFVVFRGVHEGTVVLADPLRGNLRMSVQEFMDQWSGDSLFVGKPGFGLPKEYPLAIKTDRSARPELQVARQALFPDR